MYLREIKQCYTVGQIEPKQEVYAPGSRNHGLFLKRKVQAFALKFIDYHKRSVALDELKHHFNVFNEQVLRKSLKDAKIEIDKNGCATIDKSVSVEDRIKSIISPENICQYESSEFALRRMKKLGIRYITNSSKVSYAVNKFCSEETNPENIRYARLLEEEVLCTPWNLSQSFKNIKEYG